ncbi:MAG: MBL fold metallo-hydrolase [Deltaproteobacteria bacterium]|nr:MAG: MBL fold metallo-hydrolase [Deltaproteobacteria bacterium]
MNAASAAHLSERSIGRTTVLFGERGGRYPHGNSLLVRGREETLVIDPSLGLLPRRDRLPHVDRVLNSHCHEDHIAGNHLFPEAPWHVHELDRPGFSSLDEMMAIYGFPDPIDGILRKGVVEQFHYTARPDARAFRDGDRFELGGGSRVHVIHTPGHTRGHCAFRIEPEDILYLGDIDLSSFGPYYGDAWSSLDAFERTLGRVKQEVARHYATFHHVGVLDDRAEFLARLERFAGVIAERERRLLAFLSEPRSLDEIAAHRFVYRPQDDVFFADPVERRSMGQHLERLLADGRVREDAPGRFRAV